MPVSTSFDILICNFAVSSTNGGPPAPPPPPPPPPPALSDDVQGESSKDQARNALFDDINKGENVGKGTG